MVTSLQKNETGDVKFLENNNCHQTFVSQYVPDYTSVILVTNITTANNSVLGGMRHTSMASANDDNDVSWFGHRGWQFDAAHWETSYLDSGKESFNSSKLRPARIERCYAKSINPHCTVELFPCLLWTVIVCNLIKIVCFIALLYTKFTPFVTIGDATASFLTHPDSTTERLGPLSSRDARGQWVKKIDGSMYWRERGRRTRWKSQRYRWFRGASKTRWVSTALV